MATAAALATLSGCQTTEAPEADSRQKAPVYSALTATSARFAAIGDFGDNSTEEKDVAALVKSWNPDFIVALGDNNYGGSGDFDVNIGKYYHDYIGPYHGSYGSGASTNKFWACLGNHDWDAGVSSYTNYFAYPGNERYYDVVVGPVHLFSISSDKRESGGTSSSSTQAAWLKGKLAASTSPWKIVFFHHSPYSSGTQHGSSSWMQWPFKDWGANIVLSGHEHNYERFLVNDFPYIVNGLGGKSTYSFGSSISGSKYRYNGDYGAQLIDATDRSITFKFYTRSGALKDTYTMTKPVTDPDAPIQQAEDAVLSGVVKASNQPNYTGSGFADYIHPTDDYVEWTVNAAAAGTRTLAFRYALGAAATRSLRITVNGAVANAGLVFPVTSNWGTWKEISLTAMLNAGPNKVRATAIGTSGPNIDYLTVR
ncbi:MAG TPA: metallophosphoesterase [Fibrobacteria bacterium]|nr:metallophosphoesterase [Fibrobacteria bacterium]